MFRRIRGVKPQNEEARGFKSKGVRAEARKSSDAPVWGMNPLAAMCVSTLEEEEIFVEDKSLKFGETYANAIDYQSTGCMGQELAKSSKKINDEKVYFFDTVPVDSESECLFEDVDDESIEVEEPTLGIFCASDRQSKAITKEIEAHRLTIHQFSPGDSLDKLNNKQVSAWVVDLSVEETCPLFDRVIDRCASVSSLFLADAKFGSEGLEKLKSFIEDIACVKA